MIAAGVGELAPVVGTRGACAALAVPRASHYRHLRGPRHGPPMPRPAPGGRCPSPSEPRCSASSMPRRFLDASPAAVYATLLDEGTYLASQRTMYRILTAAAEVRERRDQLRHPAYARPELLATGPNELWSWDISKLRGPVKWTYYQLYVILDVFSRYVPGWMVATRESAVLAERLIAETAAKEGIEPGQLTIHADRGTSMRSKPVALLLADLGVEQSHSRPHVSNDNPYSEAQFKTLEVPADLSRPLRLARGRPGLLRHLLHLVQHAAPPCGDRPPHPGRRPCRAGRRDHGRPGRHPRRRLRRPSRALRPPTTHAARGPHRGLDQPAGDEGGATSVICTPGCLTGLDRFRSPCGPSS